MKRIFLWIQLVAAALLTVGVWLQVYFIAAYFYGADDALDLHESVGGAVHGIEVLIFLLALGAWWRNWGRIGHAFGLAVIGTVQIALTESDDWVGGLHGLLALVILTMAVYIVKWNADALGLTRAGRGDDAGSAPPRSQP
jgi:hypothetical protein